MFEIGMGGDINMSYSMTNAISSPALIMFALCASCTVHLASTQAQADDFSTYYESTVRAREYYDQQDCQSANEALREAFRSVKYPAWRDLKKGVEIALCLQDSNLVREYCKTMASLYSILPGLDVFPDSIQYASIERELKEDIESANARFDADYAHVIDSLAEEDQKIRGHGPVIYADNINSDSVRTMRLLDLINSKGFPEQRKVGMRAYARAVLILTHADFDLNNALLGSMMYEHVMQGKMDPRDYARIIDRRCNFRGEPAIYYQVPMGFESLSAEEQEQVSLARRKIGLRSVYDSMTIEILPNGDTRAVYKY
jgi:hypothetical protein